MKVPLQTHMLLKNDDLAVADIALEASPDDSYAIALPKGSTELKDELNRILKELNDKRDN